MASVTVVVSAVKNDKRDRPFINEQDVDTNQYVTFYPRKDTNGLFSDKLVGKTVVLSGTIHNIGDNPKVIVTDVAVVK